MNRTFHIEAVAPEAGGRPSVVVQRLTVRAEDLDGVRHRAVRLLRQSQQPKWRGEAVEAVRIVDGAGSELFRWSVFDEMTARA